MLSVPPNGGTLALYQKWEVGAFRYLQYYSRITGMKTTIIVIIGLAALGAVGYLYLAHPVAPPSATNLPMGEPLPPEPLPAASSPAATTPALTETFVIDGARSRDRKS